jgi:hypothetical protein
MVDKYSDKLDGKKSIAALLDIAVASYPDYENDLNDLKFYIEQDMLGNGQAFLLRIWNDRLQIGRNEQDKGAMKEKLLTFFRTVLPEPKTNGVLWWIQALTQDVWEWMIIPTKDRLYWRDVTVYIVMMKQIFSRNKTFVDQLTNLRKLIHNDELGKSEYTIGHDDTSLEIKKWDPEHEMLVKLSLFIRTLEQKHMSEFNKYRAQNSSRWIEDPKDRQRIWSDILAGLVSLKKTYKWTDFWVEIATLKDLIDGYQLGYHIGVEITAPNGQELSIRKWESLDKIVEKMVTFISEVQKSDTKNYPNGPVLQGEKSIESKEEAKFYWTDTIAGLDHLQKKFSVNEYPSLQSLKEMIELGELGVWSNILISVWPIHLHIKKADNDKAIKNKIAIFIGELKQLASTIESDGIDEIYWRDIVGQLRGMEDAYGEYSDYQLLIMSIEAGTLGTVRDFKTVIDWVSLSIVVTDSDKILKEKLQKFIDDLKTQKKTKVDEKIVKRTQERMQQMDKEYRELQRQYVEQEKEVRKGSTKVRDQADEIRRLQDEIKQLKQAQRFIPTPSRSSFG